MRGNLILDRVGTYKNHEKKMFVKTSSIKVEVQPQKVIYCQYENKGRDKHWWAARKKQFLKEMESVDV